MPARGARGGDGCECRAGKGAGPRPAGRSLPSCTQHAPRHTKLVFAYRIHTRKSTRSSLPATASHGPPKLPARKERTLIKICPRPLFPCWWSRSPAVLIAFLNSELAFEDRMSAAIAQLGERQTEDLKVPGSIPGLGIFHDKGRTVAHNTRGVRCPCSSPLAGLGARTRPERRRVRDGERERD